MNACIVYISSRDRCIGHSIKSLWDNFNYKHDYPVYVHYFDDIYDSNEFQSSIRSATSKNTHFVSVPYETPSFVREQDLYYNRTDIHYVRSSFPIYRKGYLHMCNFTSNMFGYANTELDKYDFIMTHDDESGYTKELTCDPFKVMSDRPESFGAFFVGQRLKNGQPHQGHLDTRIGLWDFTKNFLIKNEISPNSDILKFLLKDPDAERNFHFLEWCDTYVIKTEAFKSDLWKKWISAVNEEGGIYKYRWGDNEIISLFAHIYDNKIHNLKTVETGVHDQGMFRYLQDYAPGVKDLSR